jgi:SMP-30/Gluconolactonase/LRE-like region
MKFEHIELDELKTVGTGLQRPECVLTTLKGDIYTSDSRGGILRISPDLREQLIGPADIIPNGIARLRDRSFLTANITEVGGVWRISGEPGSATIKPYLMEIEERPLIGVNFVLPDDQGRIWITVTSPLAGSGHCDRTATDGCVIVVGENEPARIVADGLCWTNECRIHPDGESLYVIETFGRRLVSYHIGQNGDLSAKRTIVEFEKGDYPDGLAFDVEGAAWVTSVISNRLIRITRSGERQVLLNDPDAALDEFETAFQNNTLTRTLLRGSKGTRLRNISSLAFGGADLRTVYLGCLGGHSLETFRSPIAGFAPVHWTW